MGVKLTIVYSLIFYFIIFYCPRLHSQLNAAPTRASWDGSDAVFTRVFKFIEPKALRVAFIPRDDSNQSYIWFFSLHFTSLFDDCSTLSHSSLSLSQNDPTIFLPK